MGHGNFQGPSELPPALAFRRTRRAMRTQSGSLKKAGRESHASRRAMSHSIPIGTSGGGATATTPQPPADAPLWAQTNVDYPMAGSLTRLPLMAHLVGPRRFLANWLRISAISAAVFCAAAGLGESLADVAPFPMHSISDAPPPEQSARMSASVPREGGSFRFFFISMAERSA